MNFKKVHPDFGIEIKDIKINKINHEEITEILNLFEEYSLIVLRDQKITNEEQLDFAKNFGELEVTKPGTIGSNSNLVILTNMDEDGKVVNHSHKQAKNDRANQQWHSDSSFKIYPAHASILNGRITPKIGGSTQFICMRNIYTNLDQSIQKQLDNLDAIHHFAHSRSKIDSSMVSQIEIDKFPPVVHPMVKINPVNNKKAVYFGSHTKSIKITHNHTKSFKIIQNHCSKSLRIIQSHSKALLKVTAQSRCSEMLISATLSSVLLLLRSASLKITRH